ncbi:MAG: RdgB/HAM1 family non-canonical purine NTP pyrophosphatase [Spirochaetes bacterium]|nr:RdgB/HAM1 family non-canonical purine NTP pyrophosphatase [Spirochaetota bacterium]
MNEIIFATFNNHKVYEINKIINNCKIVSLKDINFTDEIIENENTFIGNSLIKCRSVYQRYKKPVLADDSGICVNQLNGDPGVYSARYGSSKFNDKERYHFLLNRLDRNKDLSASFVCALVLFVSPNRIYIAQEEIKGLITFDPKGNNGFGYDPIFFLKEYGKTMAELSDEEKNLISHRGKAAKILNKFLEESKI